MRRVKRCRSQDVPLEVGVTKEGDKKRALVLSGGGAKSIFQAQVVKRLKDAGYSFDIISGVSAGSLNAAIISQKHDNEVDLWSQVRRNDLFQGGYSLWNLLKLVFGYKDSIYDNSGLENFLREVYDPKDTKIPFIIGSVNLNTSEYNQFTVQPGAKLTEWRREEIYKSIIASTSIPLVFPPVKNLGSDKDHVFVDGGLRNTAPLGSVIDKGVDEILVITCSPRHLGTTKTNLESPFAIAERSFDIFLNEVVREDIDSVLKINRLLKKHEDQKASIDGKEYRHIDISLIEPRFGLGGLLDFSEETQRKRIEEANNVCNRALET